MTAGGVGDADEEPAKRRRRGLAWQMLLRVDCSQVPEKDAARWLGEYEDAVLLVYKKIRPQLRRVTGIDKDDILQVGRFAVLEACLTYAPDRGSTLRTWVGLVVRWRMCELLERAARPVTEYVDHALAMRRAAAVQVDEFEERMEYTEQLRLLAENFAQMPHRTRIILVNRLEGTTSEEIASSLGISVVREQQIMAQTRDSLRTALAQSEVVATATPPEVRTSEV